VGPSQEKSLARRLFRWPILTTGSGTRQPAVARIPDRTRYQWPIRKAVLNQTVTMQRTNQGCQSAESGIVNVNFWWKNHR
jgi:hypothetical protein